MFLLLTILSTPFAHDFTPEQQERGASLEQDAFRVLGSWGALNVVGGGLGTMLQDEPQARAFHTMNAGWGAVNLGLALTGHISSRHRSSKQSQSERWLRLPSIFALNAGLDVAYISAGSWLWWQGSSNEMATQKGWGQSLIIQGSALLVFDTWMAAKFNALNRSIWVASLPHGLAIQGEF